MVLSRHGVVCASFAAMIIGRALMAQTVAAEGTVSVNSVNDRPGLNVLPTVAAEAPDRKVPFAKYSSIGPESNTLPEKVLRVRLPYTAAFGSKAYDDKGKASDTGFDIQASGAGLVLEYGLTSKVSLQLLAPVIFRNEMNLSKSRFPKTAIYRGAYGSLVEATALNIAAGLANPATQAATAAAYPSCVGTSQAEIVTNCSAWIMAGNTVPADLIVKDANGAALMTILKGSKITDAVDHTVLSGAAAEFQDGKTGIGDLEIGALYKFYDDGRLLSAIGLGVRLPTGSYNIDAAQRPTGRGTTDLALRYDLDYFVTPTFLLSFQNQTEQMILKGRARDEGGLIKDFERVSTRNMGFFTAKYALGQLWEKIDFIGVYYSLNYDYDADTKTGSVIAKGPESISNSYGVNFTGLDHKIPLEAEIYYTAFASGKNVRLATDSINVQAKMYYQF